MTDSFHRSFVLILDISVHIYEFISILSVNQQVLEPQVVKTVFFVAMLKQNKNQIQNRIIIAKSSFEAFQIIKWHIIYQFFL